MPFLSRRDALALGAATLATPLLAQSAPGWADVQAAATRLDQLHSLVVARAGDEVFAEAFRGPSLDRPAPVKSVSKTIVAALLGAAIDRGDIPSVDATLGDLAPALIPVGAAPEVPGITVGQMATMRMGLERTSGPNYGAWIASPNWVEDALSRPLVDQPGGRMLYSTGSYHVLGAVLSEVTGASLLTLARDFLGQPLDIDIPPWTRDPQGRFLGGNEMALSPRAMLRFGEMVRRGGAWQGRQVLTEDWIDASFVPRTQSPFSGLGYGYGWFLGQIGGTRAALARGYGGQIIAVMPEREITIAITSDPTRPARSQGYFGDLLALMGDTILPAAG